MPYVTEWIEPDTLIEHNGITIFHTYEEGDYEDVNTYWYCASVDGVYEHGAEFDVRHLSTWSDDAPDIPGAIKAAIDSGEIKKLIVVPIEDTDLA